MTILQKKALWFSFYRDVTAFHQVHSPSLFSITQHHKKRWDSPTPYPWHNFWTDSTSLFEWLSWFKELKNWMVHFWSEFSCWFEGRMQSKKKILKVTQQIMDNIILLQRYNFSKNTGFGDKWNYKQIDPLISYKSEENVNI